MAKKKCDWCGEVYDSSVCFEVNGNYSNERYGEVVSHEETVCADCISELFANDPEQIITLSMKRLEA
ncbi:MAG: hypothetical protein ACFFCI_09350 [Promethearchaeota archaeon]